MKKILQSTMGKRLISVFFFLFFLINTNIIKAQYCAAGATTCDEYISRVQVGTIDNSTTCTAGGYADYTAMSTSMDIGTGYPTTITNGTPYASDQCGIWVDWNQDFDFADANETITITGTPGNGPYTATITPPAGATPGNTRMRIRICYTTGLSSCGTATYGEVEDYTINVQAVGYCAAGATTCDEYISRVQTGTIDNSTACTAGGYANYTAMSTSMNIGTGYPTTVTNGAPYASDQCGIWVDWNQDFDFADANETITITGTPGNGPYTATITPPAGATLGNTRMRVRICYTTGLSSCGTATYGEVEDYTINVQAAGCTTPGTPITLVGTSTGQTTASLSWVTGAPAGSPTITYYWEVHLNSTDALIASGSSATSPAAVAGLTCNTTYHFHVRAYTSCDATYSAWAGPSGTFTTSACTDPCGTLTDINCGTAYPVSGTLSGTGSWNTNVLTGASCWGNDPGGEKVYRFTAGAAGTYNFSHTASPSYIDIFLCSGCPPSAGNYLGYCDDNTSSIDVVLAAGQVVYAILDEEGDATAKDYTMTVTCPVACITPGTPITLVGTSTGETTASLSWAAGAPAGSPTITYYWEVHLNSTDALVASGSSATSPAAVTGLTCNTTYHFHVRAYTSCDATYSAWAGPSGTFTTSACGSGPCSTVISIAGCGAGFPQTIVLNGAGVWNTTFCGYSTPGNEQVYSFVAPTTGTYSLQITAASGDYVDFGWQASVCASTGWNCFADVISTGTYGSAYWTAGTTYYILVDPENASPCSYTFYINCGIAAPPNDECPGATALPVNATCLYTGSTNVGASGSAVADPGCANYGGGDVWFSVVVPASGHLIFNSQAGGITDGGMAIYYGPCGSLTFIECDDDDSPNGLMPMIDASGLTPGATIYIRFWEYGGDNSGTFSICVYSPITPDPCTSVTNIAACGISQVCSPGAGSGYWNTVYCTGGAAAGMEKIYSFTPTVTGSHYIDITGATVVMDYSFQTGSCQSTGWTCIARGLYTSATYGPMNWTAGITYYILVDIEATTAGSQTFSILCPETPGDYIHPTDGLQGTYLGDCMVNTCTGVYQDDGGATNYSDNINGIYRTFCPDVTGKCMQATFTSMDIQSPCCSDYIYVLDGPTQGSPILWAGSGTLAAPSTGAGVWPGAPYTFTSTDQSGCLSFIFVSNAITNRPGWSINLGCSNCGTSLTNNDCNTAIAICGATNVAAASTGPGITSTCGGCNLSENYSSWYTFEITHDGRLDLDIKPEDFFEDYDFALYEAVDCNTLGAPIRCSYAMAPFYCRPSSTSTLYYISRVIFNSIDNTSTYNSTYFYSNYTGSTNTTVMKGSLYSLQVTLVGTSMYAVAWFDWNKNLVFDIGEYYIIGNGNNTTVSTNITIPAGASLGKTAFRVYVKRLSYVTSGNACTDYTNGEIEDYSIFIDDGTHCSNNIKDMDEEGVDCGGIDCTPCEDFATNTGTNSIASDLSEDVSGDSWVNGMPVTAGSTYYLMVNNWSPGANGFDLVWNFSAGGAMDCSTLPVELLVFTAEKYNSGAILKWTTASEKNNDRFEIMKSTDAVIWKKAGIVFGAGNSSEQLDYSFIDEEMLTQITYYRLKQVDFDGVFAFSEIKAVSPNENLLIEELKTSYDQISDNILISFNASPGIDYNIKITDIAGKSLYITSKVTDSVRNTVMIPAGSLSAGLYMINLSNSDVSLSNKLIIIK
ncbi:MAG: GEVED domain-containing protein [Bacteroidota bacterium]